MTIKNADMPAMPNTLANVSDTSVITRKTEGLTKREHFAAMAMQGLLANSGGVIQSNSLSGTGWCNGDSESMAKLAIECADALLEELFK